MSALSEELKTEVVLAPCTRWPCLGSGAPFLHKEIALLGSACFVHVFLDVAEGTGKACMKALN